MPNNTGPYPYYWQTQKQAADIRPQLSVVSIDDNDGPGPGPLTREIATEAYLDALDVPHRLITIAGDEHCPSGDHIDDDGDDLFESMLWWAVNYGIDMHCEEASISIPHTLQHSTQDERYETFFVLAACVAGVAFMFTLVYMYMSVCCGGTDADYSDYSE